MYTLTVHSLGLNFVYPAPTWHQICIAEHYQNCQCVTALCSRNHNEFIAAFHSSFRTELIVAHRPHCNLYGFHATVHLRSSVSVDSLDICVLRSLATICTSAYYLYICVVYFHRSWIFPKISFRKYILVLFCRWRNGTQYVALKWWDSRSSSRTESSVLHTPNGVSLNDRTSR